MNRKQRRKSAAALGLTAAVALTLTGCGSSSSSANGVKQAPRPSAAPTAAAPTGTPIKIAIITEVTGPSSTSYSAMKPIAQAWANNVNKNEGGIAGHPVALSIVDTQGESATAATAANQLVSDRSVSFAVFGDSGTEAIVPAILSKGGLPVEAVQPQLPTVYGKLRNVWTTGVWIPAIQAAGVMSTKLDGKKNTAVALCSEVPACKGAAQSIEQIATKDGLQWGGSYILSASDPNYTPACLDLVTKGVQDFGPFLVDSAAVRLIQTCSQQGYKGAWELSSEKADQTVLDALPPGAVAHGPLESFPWWVNAAPVANYRAVMQSNGVSESVYGSDTATQTWSELELFRKAMDDRASTLTGTVTRQDVIDAFGHVKSETLGGLLPQPLTFSANEPTPLVNCFFDFQYQNGKFVAVPGGLTATCLK